MPDTLEPGEKFLSFEVSMTAIGLLPRFVCPLSEDFADGLLNFFKNIIGRDCISTPCFGYLNNAVIFLEDRFFKIRLTPGFGQ